MKQLLTFIRFSRLHTTIATSLQVTGLLILAGGLVEGVVRICWGKLSTAHKLLDETFFKTLEEVPKPILRPTCLTAVANLAAKERQWEQAWKDYKCAEDCTGQLLPLYRVLNFWNWGCAHIARGEDGDREQAIELFQKALEIFGPLGADGWVRRMEEKLAGTET